MDGPVISLDEEILDNVFRVPNKVELCLSASQTNTCRATGFGAEAMCDNGYYVKKCSDALMLERILFQRYALHMQKN